MYFFLCSLIILVCTPVLSRTLLTNIIIYTTLPACAFVYYYIIIDNIIITTGSTEDANNNTTGGTNNNTTNNNIDTRPTSNCFLKVLDNLNNHHNMTDIDKKI